VDHYIDDCGIRTDSLVRAIDDVLDELGFHDSRQLGGDVDLDEWHVNAFCFGRGRKSGLLVEMLQEGHVVEVAGNEIRQMLAGFDEVDAVSLSDN
jgi:hypothetical protein